MNSFDSEIQLFDSNNHILLIYDKPVKFDSAVLYLSDMILRFKINAKIFLSEFDYQPTLTFINTKFITKIRVADFKFKNSYANITELLYGDDNTNLIFKVLDVNLEFFSKNLEQGDRFL